MVDVNEAEARFEELIADVEAGEAFVICRNGVPVVRLIPCHDERRGAAPGGDKVVAQNDDGRR
jgi:prevent-host-death family protein